MKSLLLIVSLLAAGALAGLGCEEEGPGPPVPALPDAGPALLDPTPSPPDAGTGDAGPALIPLETWVHALVTDDLDGTRPPDTVEDKPAIVQDTEEESAFDDLLTMPAPAPAL